MHLNIKMDIIYILFHFTQMNLFYICYSAAPLLNLINNLRDNEENKANFKVAVDDEKGYLEKQLYIGGVTGWQQNTYLKDVYVDMTVPNTNNSHTFIGGVAGHAHNTDNDRDADVIDAKVKLNLGVEDDFGLNSDEESIVERIVGGLIGQSSQTIKV